MKSQPKFSIADELTRDHERGYANHAKDKGGETLNGIARKHWPNWPVWQYIDKCKQHNGFPQNIDMDALQDHIAQFYLDNFWNKIKGDQLGNQLVANQVYDIAVNGGVGQAGIYLQRTLNLLNRNGRDYSDIKVDGGIGNKTIDALNSYLAKRDNGEYYLGFLLVSQMAALWVELCTKDPEQEAFMNGWVKRGASNALQFTTAYLKEESEART